MASPERDRRPDQSVLFQWEEGYDRLQAARSDPALYRALGRLVVAVQDELRRRLGSTFTVGELVDLYREGTDWALELAIGRNPEDSRLLGSVDRRRRRFLPLHARGRRLCRRARSRLVLVRLVGRGGAVGWPDRDRIGGDGHHHRALTGPVV